MARGNTPWVGVFSAPAGLAAWLPRWSKAPRHFHCPVARPPSAVGPPKPVLNEGFGNREGLRAPRFQGGAPPAPVRSGGGHSLRRLPEWAPSRCSCGRGRLTGGSTRKGDGFLVPTSIPVPLVAVSSSKRGAALAS
ncbi:uncharacterized protein A4U43_C07F34350 [Asparagus officinalis]|uniref:Uncharacterized protein n=1 Tax=Asparagus officinalis TaxID=4686 RepID=A0A5P1EHA1_ASPOF|nr:uncharacterized protein A4U43_C07F34350 [Asparagus officinalis]